MKDPLENIVPSSLRSMYESPIFKYLNQISTITQPYRKILKSFYAEQTSPALQEFRRISAAMLDEQTSLAARESQRMRNAILSEQTSEMTRFYRNVIGASLDNNNIFATHQAYMTANLPSIAVLGSFKMPTMDLGIISKAYAEQSSIIKTLIEQQSALLSIHLPELKAEHIAVFNELINESIEDSQKIDIADSATDLAEVFNAIENKEANQEFWSLLLSLLTKENIIFLLTILSPLLSYYSSYQAAIDATRAIQKETASATKVSKEDKKELSLHAKKVHCEEFLRLCKFVAKDQLEVYTAPGKKFEVINQLNFGTGVYVLDREDSRSWSYVEFYDKQDAEYKRGWILSRYLERFITYPRIQY